MTATLSTDRLVDFCGPSGYVDRMGSRTGANDATGATGRTGATDAAILAAVQEVP